MCESTSTSTWEITPGTERRRGLTYGPTDGAKRQPDDREHQSAPVRRGAAGLYFAQGRAAAPHDSRLLRLRFNSWSVRGYRELVLAAEVRHRQPRVGLPHEADDLGSVNSEVLGVTRTSR